MFGFQPKSKREDAAPAAPVDGARGFVPRSKAAVVQSSPDAALGFHPGAMRAQAQNQAPDSIPGMFKPGEFVLPPDTVHAMGGKEALQGVVDATHTPAPDDALVPRGFKPRAFFAQGGAPEDQERKQISPTNIYPQGSPAAGRSPYVGSLAAAPAAPGGFTPRTQGPSELYMQDRTQEMKDQLGAGNYAQAAGTAARTAVQGLGMYGIEVADKLTAPVVNGARGFGEGLFGSANPAPAPAARPSAASAPAAPAAAPAPVGGFAPYQEEASRRSGTQQAAAGATITAAGTEQGTAGVYQHGRGQYSDNPAGMGFTPGFTGKPSAQNNAAGENLALGFRPGMRAEPAPLPGLGFGPGGVAAPVARHSGNDWQARNDLRNAEVSASSIQNTRRFGGRGAENNPAAVAYRSALATDQTLRQAQPGMDTEAMRQNAALTREGMQQAGETQRAGTRAAIEAQRTGIAAQQADTQRRSVDSQVEAQGYANRVAAQQEQLRGVLVDPNATPQQKAQAQQSLRALAGQGQNDWRVQVTPAVKNADGSTSEGSVLRYNQATGDVQRVDVGQARGTGPVTISNDAAGRQAFAALQSGAEFVGPDGRTYRKD